MFDFDLTVVIPALNEEKALGHTIDSLVEVFTKELRDYRIIVINDGSTDGTQGIMDSYRDGNPRVILLKNEKPRGIGYCFKRGLSEARTRYIAWFPSDSEFPAREFVKCFRYVAGDTVVIPYAVNDTKVRTFFRLALSKVYTWIYSAIYGMKLHYFNGMSIYSVGSVRSLDIISDGFTFPAEILVKLIRQGYPYAEAAVEIGVRKGGVSKAVRFKTLINVTYSTIAIWLDVNVFGRSESSKNPFQSPSMAEKSEKVGSAT